MREGAHPPCFLLIEEAERIEVLHLAREFNRKLFGIEFFNVVGTVGPFEDAVPSRLHIVANGSDESEACNYYSSFHSGQWSVVGGQFEEAIFLSNDCTRPLIILPISADLSSRAPLSSDETYDCISAINI
jgi:hypothetical protein